MNKIWLPLAFGIVLLLETSPTNAADGDGGLSASGDSVVEVDPERMRLKIEIKFKGKDLAEALTKLKARQPQLEKQLNSLGATKDTIKLGDPHIDESQGQDQTQIFRAMNRMSGRRGRKPAEDLFTIAVAKVRTELTAEWPLKFSDRADLLIQIAKLQDAIKAADLGGLRAKDDDSPEEEELIDEMEGIQEMYGNQNRPKPGEPSFLFVAAISVAQREKALAEAFRRARDQATHLSKAADLELGAVRNLTSQAADGMDDDEGPYATSSYYRNRSDGHDDEAIAPVAGTLKKRFHVQAVFLITPRKVASGPAGSSQP